jgi:uncharacterized membrane protein
MSSCCGIGRHNKEKKGKLALVIGILLAMVAIAALFHYVNAGRLSWLNQGQAQAAVTPVTTGNEVAFPEASFADGKAKFFDYKTSDGKKVRYFVIKSSDGVIRAAFDACDVCYEAGKGNFQQDDFMVCRNCGRRFQSTKVNVVTGGCNPSALTRTIRDGKVVIPVQALNEGRKFFN